MPTRGHNLPRRIDYKTSLSIYNIPVRDVGVNSFKSRGCLKLKREERLEKKTKHKIFSRHARDPASNNGQSPDEFTVKVYIPAPSIPCETSPNVGLPRSS